MSLPPKQAHPPEIARKCYFWWALELKFPSSSSPTFCGLNYYSCYRRQLRLGQDATDFRYKPRVQLTSDIGAVKVKIHKIDNFVFEKTLKLRLAIGISLSQAQIGVDCLVEVNSG